MSTVCVVDDDPDIREAISIVLGMHGHDVIEASDGADALRRLHGAGAELILLDLMMPGMNGWEFIEALRADPELASTPVVLISGAGDLSEEAKRIGGVTWAQKPIELRELLAHVDRIAHH